MEIRGRRNRTALRGNQESQAEKARRCKIRRLLHRVVPWSLDCFRRPSGFALSPEQAAPTYWIELAISLGEGADES